MYPMAIGDLAMVILQILYSGNLRLDLSLSPLPLPRHKLPQRSHKQRDNRTRKQGRVDSVLVFRGEVQERKHAWIEERS